eukprot:TRINITY_DN87968_c2_g1_i1.p1 TRINITY_DN87968_c2_g1~~TRINITY_DN87968_c2_g1_i1.p1  ORF type:complete len:2564 (+),score=195.91 TRINITY_DN87968_c2_g1_i1:1053-8744(+)
MGHTSHDSNYGSSGIMGNFLLIAYNTNKSHQLIPLDPGLDVEFAVLRTETGEGSASDCQMVLRGSEGPTKVMDLVSAGENGIYALLSVSKGELEYVNEGTVYEFSAPSFAIGFFELDIVSTPSAPTLRLLDIEAYSKATSALKTHPPVRLLLYYPSGTPGYGVPELLLAGHLEPSERTGLLIYGFSVKTADANDASPTSYNPFVTDSACTDTTKCSRCLAINPSKCVECKATNFLANLFTCTATNCPNGWYKDSTNTCAQCHSTCAQCTGPLRTQCTSCSADKTLDAFSSQCLCNSGTYYRNGACVPGCSTGQSGLYIGNTCRDKCPAHTFSFADYSNAIPTTGPMSAEEGSDLLKFTSGSGCLQLPGPTGATKVPNEFTVSMWVYITSAMTPHTFLWGFNAFALTASPNAGNFEIQFSVLDDSLGSISVPSPLHSDWIFTPNTWNFVAASVKNSPSGYSMQVFTSPHIIPGGLTNGIKNSPSPIVYKEYTNTILVGCEGSFDPTTDTLSVTQNIQFNGYVRELVYQNKYYGKDMMSTNKALVYSLCLEVYKYVMSYWRFDSLQETATEIALKDSSKNALSSSILKSGNPTKESTSVPMVSRNVATNKWEVLGTCVNLFDNSQFPAFSLDTADFAAHELEPRLNLNDPSVLWELVREGDKIRLILGGCKSGQLLQEASVELDATGRIKIEQNRPLPKTVRGKHVDVCYYSPSLDSVIALGKTYFPIVPNQVFPSHGASEAASVTPLQFELRGGDQSLNDRITLVNVERDVKSALGETIIVNEGSGVFESYSSAKQSNGKYKDIVTTGLDRGTYTLAWRPSYMYYAVSGQNVLYKNLFTTWALQETPKAKFPPLAGAPNSFKNSVIFKGELFYPDLVGSGQADGDQLIFCHTGCNYPNKKGPVYQRVNGQYPPVWFGEDSGVSNLLGNALFERLFLCWRPAAKTSYIEPGDDQWVPVYDLQRDGVSAYVFVNFVSDNSDIPEIDAINPPYSNPVLHQGETVWFTLTKCRSLYPKPAVNEAVPGKVELVHLTYNSYNRSSYTTETVWSQELSNPTEDAGYTVGKLHGDPDACNFTLQDIPFNVMQPGHDYMLIIYSKSFVGGVDKYLFGEVAAGTPQFKYIFRYQEASFNVEYEKGISPTETEIVIKGTNLGTVSVPGNGYTETRKLFGVIVNTVADPPCGNGELRTSYVVNNLDDNPSEIRLSDLDLSSCNSTLSVSLKLIKVSDDFTSYPLWSYSSTYQPVTVGFVGCHSSCKTCNGTNSSNCLSCHTTGPLPYLYKGRCLAKCEPDLPFADVVFEPGTYFLDYYRCTKSCAPGYYLDTRLGLCMQCNYQCRTCTSGNTMSCVDCKGMPVADPNGTLNYNNTFKETFLFNKMCMLECPVITNDLSSSKPNVIEADYYEHKCLVGYKPQRTSPISVKVQPIIFPERVNIKRGIYLRALVNDPTSSLTSMAWSAHPEEDLTLPDFYNSDRRIFLSYDYENLNTSITQLNMNAFNYKGDTEQMRIVVKAFTNDSLDFDVIELYGDRPPELKDENVFFQPSKGLTTGSYVNITINEIQDADDYFEVLKFKVLLIVRSLVIPDDVQSPTAKSALMLLAQLPERTITIHSSRIIAPGDDKTVVLQNVYIPPLVNGPQKIGSDVTTSVLSCDFFIMVEDRHLGVSKSKFTFNITETYRPELRSEMIQELYDHIMEKDKLNKMEWDDVLRVAHVFKSINPNHTLYFMSYTYCSRDNQCDNQGKCATSGGWSECICKPGYTGTLCSWKLQELYLEQEIAKVVILYLNTTILTQTKTYTDFDSNYTVSDTNMLDQVANILIGLLKSPEVVRPEYLTYIVQLCDYITKVDLVVGGRLEEFEKENLFNAIDAVIKYAYYHLRQNIYEFYVLGESRKQYSVNVEAQYTAVRNTLAETIMGIRNGLYRLVDAISSAQHPDSKPFSATYDSFEVLVTAETEDRLFGNLDGALAIQTKSGKGFIKIPRTVLDSVRDRVSNNEEFKIRIVRWTENPYVFSDYHSEVCTSVYSMALLDSNSTVLSLNLSEPIVFFLPFSNLTKNFPTDIIRCKYFNSSYYSNVTIAVPRKVNVNQLNISDAEKRATYPEWDPKLYQYAPLIVETEEYQTVEALYPEFTDVPGISSYGNTLKPAEYPDVVPCAAYHLSEVAAVAQRRKSIGREPPPISFYHYFDPLSNLDVNLGVYACIFIAVLFIGGMVGTYVMDLILLPQHERLIMLHRPEYLDKDQEMKESPPDSHISANPLISGKSDKSGSDEGNLSGSMEEEIKMEATPANNPVPRPRRKKSNATRKLAKKGGSGSGDSSRAHSGHENPKDSLPDENLTKKQSMHSAMDQSQTKIELKEAGDTNNSTQNQTTTQELTTSPFNKHTSSVGRSSLEDSSPDKLFSSVNADDIRKKDKEENKKTENIFSKDHLERREIESFKFVNLFISSNMILNICTRSNTVFTRPARCFIFFTSIYFAMFWCAILLATSTPILDHPEEIKGVPSLLIDNLWIIFTSPIVSCIVLYLVAGVFKVNEALVQETKTSVKYKHVMQVCVYCKKNIGRNLKESCSCAGRLAQV